MTVSPRTGIEDLSIAGLRDPVTSLIEPFLGRLGNPDRVLVIPDVAYPFHPTTGMVTNPAVVEALVASLRISAPEVPVGVALAGSEHADGRRSGRYLGYEALIDRLGLEYVDLEEVERVSVTSQVGATPRSVTVPLVLTECPVVNVPTLRSDHDHGLVAGMLNLARAAGERDFRPQDIVATARALDPAITILDGTYTYTGAPHRSEFLLAAGDVVSLDRYAASLLGRAPAEVPYLRVTSDTDTGDPALERTIEALRSALPNENPPGPFEPGRAMRLGYRMYAHLTGDAIPPMFLDG